MSNWADLAESDSRSASAGSFDKSDTGHLRQVDEGVFVISDSPKNGNGGGGRGIKSGRKKTLLSQIAQGQRKGSSRKGQQNGNYNNKIKFKKHAKQHNKTIKLGKNAKTIRI